MYDLEMCQVEGHETQGAGRKRARLEIRKRTLALNSRDESARDGPTG